MKNTALTSTAGLKAALTDIARQRDALTDIARQRDNFTDIAGQRDALTSIAGLKANFTDIAGQSSALGSIAGLKANFTSIAGLKANFTDDSKLGAITAVDYTNLFFTILIAAVLAIGVIFIIYRRVKKAPDTGGVEGVEKLLKGGKRLLEETFLGDYEYVFAGATMVLLLLLVAFYVGWKKTKTARRCATFAVEECDDDMV